MKRFVEVYGGKVRFIGTAALVPSSFPDLQIVDITDYTGSVQQGMIYTGSIFVNP